MRHFEFEIMPVIQERWSPRAFSEKPIDPLDLKSVLEAARWAPSCFNEQPWRFVVGVGKEGLKAFHEALLPKNALWAKKAPVMILICAQKVFSQSGKENPYHAFDSGTAWGFLALEAKKRGLMTHAMAGFRKEQLIEALLLPHDWTVIALVAMGYYGEIKDLDEQLVQQEEPGDRRSLETFIYTPNAFVEDLK